MDMTNMKMPHKFHSPCTVCRTAGKGRRPRRAMIDRNHMVPEIAGYNVDGSVLYIDKRLPDVIGGVPVAKYLEIHEEVENALEFRLGFSYAHAHVMAEAAEQAAVELDGYDWKPYNDGMNEWIKKLENDYDESEVPEDLINPNKVEGK